MELWHFCILLTYLFAGFAHSLSSKKWLQGTLGKSLLLPADIPQGFQVREASWRFLSTTEDILASFFKGTVEMMYKSRFLNRTHLHENFSLQISDLRIEDSGDFELRLVNSEGGKRTQDFAITVYESRKRHENVNYCFLLSIILPACVVILCALATILLSNKKCRDNKNSKPIDDDCALPSLREVESLHEDGNLVPSASLSDSFELREDELCQNN
ncbi:uncharacterized protein LOC122807238 isoform X2 [Protopterus annectens]|uniref:uncharacterized protein LOC122807238 isoform X2 n=1 Tax=Protopterus annectens TaxID=7888 RepID=UPI001CFB91A8|nr:uncharacterized protein LOC122807238 isoform X2 [Protopterus annectens]